MPTQAILTGNPLHSMDAILIVQVTLITSSNEKCCLALGTVAEVCLAWKRAACFKSYTASTAVI